MNMEASRAFLNHETAQHSVVEYINGQAHTNGVEPSWSMLKRGYHGTYHWMSEKHLDRYIGEFASRHNIRCFDTIKRMAAIIQSLEGTRLRYEDLVA